MSSCELWGPILHDVFKVRRHQYWPFLFGVSMVKHELSENALTLFPHTRRRGITMESKAKFTQRIESDGCNLELNDCKRKHLAGCLTAMRQRREWLKSNWLISDPRFDEPRACTGKEIYWYLINDPRSEFSLVYGQKDRVTAEEFFSQWAEQNALGESDGVQKAAETVVPSVVPPPAKSKPVVAKKAVVTSSLPDSGMDPDVTQAESVDWSEKKAWKMTDVIRWVFDNMKNPDLDLSSAPCPGAIALLRWAEHKGGDSQFFTYFLTKLVPSQKDLEASERRADNGSNLFPLLDELLKETV